MWQERMDGYVVDRGEVGELVLETWRRLVRQDIM